MQEKNVTNRNISKKKSENIKIPKKMQEKIKDNCNVTTNNMYNKNCSNNNSILINKSNVKIDLNKNYKRTNLRSISHSTKCMMKIKYRDKEKDKYQPLIKTKKKYSITKDKKILKEENSNKSKKNTNTKDLLNKKNNNNDLNNHSFNYFRKTQNSNNNNSLKNIESSCYSDFYCPNNKNTKKQKIKKKDKTNYLNNDNKNNFILPFYYCVKKGDKKYNIKKKINYSEKSDYYNILQNLNSIPISELAIKLVGLSERKWLNELKDNLALIEKNKSINFETNLLNEFIKGRLIIQEDFNWLIWAISYVFQNKIIINKNNLNLDDNKNTEKKINFNNTDDINNIISVNDIEKWRDGFIYNGVYFFLLDKIENYNEIKIIKREIKSLNLLFLDYIQLLDNIPANINDTKPLLTNNIIFPLLSMAELTNYYIVGSLALDPIFIDKKNKNNNLNEDDYLNNYYGEVDISNYNMNNLKNSPFFANLTGNNLLNLSNGKFLLINIAKDLHPLLIPKNVDNEEYLYDNNYFNYIFLKYPLITNQIMKDENFFNKSSFLVYFKYFINYLISNKYITDMPSLEYEMNKFGINKCFYLFILSRIRFNNSCDIETNNNISSLIKIYILVKLLVKIDDLQFINNDKNIQDKNIDNNNNNTNKNISTDIEKEIKSETSCGTTNGNNNFKTNIKYNTERKNELNTIYINFNEIFNKENQNNKFINNIGLKTISQLILFILSPKSIMIEINNDDLVQKLLFQCNIYLENFKNLSNKLFSNDVNSLYEPKSFLKSLIISARKNPLIFLKQIENKFNILFNYEIKYCTSICIENFIKYFNANQIIEKDPKIISYINGEELSFYLIIKNISSFHQKNKSNCFKKKGSKMIKNVSYDNMDIYSGKYNYDNLSILNRSIIQPRNSNFKILNSSKDKPKIKSFNNIHICSNSNSKNINKNNQIKNNDRDNVNINLTGTNNSELNTNKDSLNTNINSNESINKNILSSYKTNQTQFTNNYKNNDNISVVDNFVIASSSSKDMFEFNYGDEDSDKSFNIGYGDSGQPSNFNKKRNTTNLNNSKFNLNNNKINASGNNCKTINAKNYNLNNNMNICLNNIVINNKNPINNMTPSCSSGLINNHNKIYFGTENKEQYWRCLFNNYHLKFPYNLYKVPTQNNKSSLLIYRYLSMHYSFFPFYNNNFSFIKNANKDKNSNNETNISEMLNDQKLILEKIFSDILSINSKSSYALINFYLYYFLNYYYVENNQLKECEQIISKINNIFENKMLYKQNNYNIIINLINGLLNDKIDFLKTYKYFDKALILSLIQYGEPRGRNNDGNNIMIFPVWKTGRNCMILDNNEILNENYKELYHCLYYLYDNKRNNKSFLNDIKNYKLIDKNIINDLYRNIEYIKKIFKKNQKIKKIPELNNINIDSNINPFDSKNNMGDKNNSKKNNSGNEEQNYLQSQNEDTFFNFDDEEMLERPSKANNVYDEFCNVNEENNNSININTPIYSNNLNNILSKKNSMNNHFNSYNNNSNILNNNLNSKIIPTINPEWTFDIYFKENSTYANIIFPSMSDKKTAYINSFFLTEKFFIFFTKTLFALINYSENELTYTNEYLKKNVFTDSTISNNKNNNASVKSTSKQKKTKSIFTRILTENLYYKKYTQSNVIVTFGNNTHCETGHKGYKFLSLPRILYHLKNKEIISVKSGWEHSIAQDKEKMLYSWGNNSCCQCGFESNETSNGNIFFPKNISQLNDKNIIEISCGNEHTLALSNKGEVYSWGSISDGVLGRDISNIKENCTGIAEPGKINYFIENNIKIRHISSGSIHNLCLDDKSNLYSFGCSKGGQLGLDEEELSILYKQNNSNLNKNNINKEKENNFSINEPKLIKTLKDIEIIKISSGEAHNAALSLDGKCYVWGFGSNGQLGLGFCGDYFPSGEGMQKSRIFTPTVIKEFDKKNNRISKVFCGKTFTIFLNKNDELYSTGINDLNQCGIDNNKTFINENFCYDIVTPIKIEMFIRMKIINVSCGESHVLAITEDNCIKTLFSWGSNRFGQLGQGIQTKQSMPKIVNYFLHYKNSEVCKVSCGAFHSLALLRSKNEENINSNLDEKYILDFIDKCEEY